MIDLRLLVEKTEYVREALAKKNCHVNLDEVKAWIKQKRDLLQTSEKLKAERNRMNKEIGELGRSGQNIEKYLVDLTALKEKISQQAFVINFAPHVYVATANLS